MKTTIVVLFLLLAIPAHAKEKVWIMWGQSLMATGTTANLPPSMCDIPGNVEVWTLDIISGLVARSESFCAQSSFGPEVGFAYSISAMHPGDYHVIVRYAVSGTSMERWRKGGDLYDGLIQTVRLVTAGRKVKIEAILGDQGESDAEARDATAYYQGRMSGMMKGLREAFKNPKLPWFIGLECSPVLPYTFQVAQSQLQIIATDGHARGIDYSTLPKLQTGPYANLHLTDASELEFGQMFAYAVAQSGLCQ